MKIIYITSTFPYSSGKESFFSPELKEIVKQGHQLIVIPRSASGSLEPSAASIDATYIMDPLLSFRVLLDAAIALLTQPVNIITMILRILSRGSLLNRLKNAAVIPKGLFVGRLANRWHADHIHAQWAHTPATIGFVAHQYSEVPWSFTAHRGDIVLSNLIPEKVDTAQLVRFISESGILLASRLVDGMPLRNCRIIHMGVSLPDISKLPPFGLKASKLFCAANLIPVKGHSYLIQAMAILRDLGVECTLELAGDGHLRHELESQVLHLQLQHKVKFLGNLSHPDLLQRYARGEVDLFVLPSIDLGNGNKEGIPVSLIEAMAYRIPVVATSTGGIPELIGNDAGWLVPPNSSEALAEAITALLTRSDMLQAYGEQGRKRVEKAFNVAITTSSLLEEFHASRQAELLS